MVRWLFRWIFRLLLFFFISTIGSVVLYRYIPVYYTPLMLIRCYEQKKAGKDMVLKHKWVSYEAINLELSRAVIASEDNRFFEHFGFDTIEIKRAMKENEKRKKARGASTITQQTAKNVFLWPSSSWLRKGFEVYFTLLVEACWSKERILEVYLNSIEMGPGIYGVSAVAAYSFNTTPTKLSKAQCALIAATLPNPLRFSSKTPSAYVRNRQSTILQRMNWVVLEQDGKKKVTKARKK